MSWPGRGPGEASLQSGDTYVEVTAIEAHNYAGSERVAQTLVAEGVQAIELCGGFVNLGTARIVKAVAGKAAVGAVRFDGHPRLVGKSGDELFGG